MILIFNTIVANNKNLKISLTIIVGLSKSKITYILKKIGISNTVKFKNLSELHVKNLQDIVKKLNLKINRNLKKYQQQFLEHLEEIRKYTFIKKKLKKYT